MLNVDLDEKTAEDGRSFSRALIGKERPQSFQEAFVHNTRVRRSAKSFSIRRENYKLKIEGPQSNSDLMNNSIPTLFKLYNLNNDIIETNDISGNQREIVKELFGLHREFIIKGRTNYFFPFGRNKHDQVNTKE